MPFTTVPGYVVFAVIKTFGTDESGESNVIVLLVAVFAADGVIESEPTLIFDALNVPVTLTFFRNFASIDTPKQSSADTPPNSIPLPVLRMSIKLKDVGMSRYAVTVPKKSVTSNDNSY